MSHNNRRLFADLSAPLSDDERDLQAARKRGRDVLVCLALAASAVGLALYMAQSQQDTLDAVREAARTQAQHEAQAHWVPQVLAAYHQGQRAECERQQRARLRQLGDAHPALACSEGR